MIDVLVLAAALAQQAQKVPASIEVSAVVTFADGGTRRVSRFPGARLSYFHVAGSMCDELTASEKAPRENLFGWKVDLVPVGNGDSDIIWRRLDASAASVGAKNGARTLPAETPIWIPLDTIAPPCAKILSWTLEARRASSAKQVPQSNLVEAELWFVHKAPDGKETSQKQTIRMRPNNQTDFYFDDIVVNASVGDRTEPITVEVYGSMVFDRLPAGDQLWSRLFLTRRYINPKAAALGLPPTVGKGTHDVTVSPGEVVSFVLPPIEKDTGQFVGHRFSVRVRIKPIG